jgi:cyclophilin family peptidyl-prolyl cis-trans isomerase
VAGIVVIALIVAYLTSRGGSSKKTVTTTLSGPLASLEANLVPRTPPPTSTDCTAPAAKETAPPTTIPAKGNAVAIIPAPATVPFPNLDGSSPHYTKFSAAPPFCIDVDKTYTATMKTDVGTITITLLPKYAPVTVNNFVFLAGYHYFDGTVFHRVIPGFVDQGGDPTGTGSGTPGYSFKDELPKSKAAYDDGAVAMANSGANTNGSQFFLVVGAGGAELGKPAYSMYGQVISGLSAANKINSEGQASGTPKVLNKILSVTISVTKGSASTPTTTPAAPSTTSASATTSAPGTTSAPTTTPTTS